MSKSNSGTKKTQNTACSFWVDRKDFWNNGHLFSDTSEQKLRLLVNRNKYIYVDRGEYFAETNQYFYTDLF